MNMDVVDSQNDMEKLLESLFDVYGYDFRNYSHAHIQRRPGQR